MTATQRHISRHVRRERQDCRCRLRLFSVSYDFFLPQPYAMKSCLKYIFLQTALRRWPHVTSQSSIDFATIFHRFLMSFAAIILITCCHYFAETVDEPGRFRAISDIHIITFYFRLLISYCYV